MTAPTIDADTVHAYADRIRAAYRQLATRPGDLVSLADLRPQVGGHRGHVDAALIHLARQRGCILIPEANQKTLTSWDRECAVLHGGQAKHAISIG